MVPQLKEQTMPFKDKLPYWQAVQRFMAGVPDPNCRADRRVAEHAAVREIERAEDRAKAVKSKVRVLVEALREENAKLRGRLSIIEVRLAKAEAFTKTASIREAESAVDAAIPATDESGSHRHGLRTERVTLEVTHRSPVSVEGWALHSMLSLEGGESVRVVEDRAGTDMGNGVFVASTDEVLAMCRETEARLTAERNAAREECERLRARVAELEVAHAANAAGDSKQEPVAWGGGGGGVSARDIVERLRDQSQTASDYCDSCKCDKDKADAASEIARLRARVAELEVAPAANAGGEAKHEPVAWGVRRKSGTWWNTCFDRRDRMESCIQGADAEDSVVLPLYAAPQPPRGWLTAEDREALYLACAVLHGVFVGSWREKHEAAKRLEAIRVRAIREAGGEVE